MWCIKHQADDKLCGCARIAATPALSGREFPYPETPEQRARQLAFNTAYLRAEPFAFGLFRRLRPTDRTAAYSEVLVIPALIDRSILFDDKDPFIEYGRRWVNGFDTVPSWPGPYGTGSAKSGDIQVVNPYTVDLGVFVAREDPSLEQSPVGEPFVTGGNLYRPGPSDHSRGEEWPYNYEWPDNSLWADSRGLFRKHFIDVGAGPSPTWSLEGKPIR